MSADCGSVDYIAFRVKGGGDQTENFRRETVDGNETILKISRRHPNCSGSRCYLVDLEVRRVRHLAFGGEGGCCTSSSLKRKALGLHTNLKERSVECLSLRQREWGIPRRRLYQSV
jgi:hypothetical protein